MDQNFLDDIESSGDDEDEFDSAVGNIQEQKQTTEEKDQDVKQEIKQALSEFKTEFQHQTKSVSQLLQDSDFRKHMEKVISNSGSTEDKLQFQEGDEEYSLIQKCNEYGSILDNEINAIQRYVSSMFSSTFSDLEQIVLDPVDYAKTVKLIQNEQDLNKIDLSQLLTNHQIVAINVAHSTSVGKPQSERDLEKILYSCDQIITLDDYKKKLVAYIESRMRCIAPNLTVLVGSHCASRLILAAGGVQNLATMPACNIQVMGSQKRALLGFSKSGQGLHRGLFGSLEFVQKTPAKFQTKLVRMLSTNVAKCIKIDFLRTSPDGSAGTMIKEQMIKRFAKIQEPPPAKQNTALPIPEDKPKKKRGGRKQHKFNQKFKITEVRQSFNRLKFGVDAEEEYRETGEGFGMLSKETGKVKLNIDKEQKLVISKSQQKRLVPLKSTGQKEIPSGMASSIVFTPIQGIELINPEGLQKKQEAPENYFNKKIGFRTVLQNKKKDKINLLENILGNQQNQQ